MNLATFVIEKDRNKIETSKKVDEESTRTEGSKPTKDVNVRDSSRHNM